MQNKKEQRWQIAEILMPSQLKNLFQFMAMKL